MVVPRFAGSAPHSICVSQSTPPLTPDLSPTSPSSFSSRRRSSLHIDFSSLQSIKEPTRPTNTLILTNLSSAVFQSDLLQVFRETVASIAPIAVWIPLKSFLRVVVAFEAADVAIEVREALDGQPLLQQAIKIFYGETTKLHGSSVRDSLQVPPLEKNWLISPPGSPPVGWTQVREDPPNSQILHEDLLDALARLPKSRQIQNEDSDEEDYGTEMPNTDHVREVTLLESNRTSGPGIVVHLETAPSLHIAGRNGIGGIERTKLQSSVVKTRLVNLHDGARIVRETAAAASNEIWRCDDSSNCVGGTTLHYNVSVPSMEQLIPGVQIKRPPEDVGHSGHELIVLLKDLFASKARLNGDKRQTVKCTDLSVPNHPTATLQSWKFDEFSYGKPEKPLPSNARGLFSYTNPMTGRHSIVLRGYDKFFNTDEVVATKWNNIEQETTGPYDLTLKQNGCIIFIGALDDGTLLVSSKHSIGSRNDTGESHSERGRKWLLKHLQGSGRTEQELATILYKNALTAVCELCDDDFEEHILGYSPEKSGLYLHGLNLNTPIFSTYSIEEVGQFAAYFGFLSNPHIKVSNLVALRSLLDECAKTGTYQGTEVEGFVVRTQAKHHDFFFKYKFEEPYLLFRQWREVTKALIAGHEPRFRRHHDITKEYIKFVLPIIQDPIVAKRFNENHGIISLRQQFLSHHGGDLTELIANSQRSIGTEFPDQVDWNTDRFVLVPIATIGCGKTTIAVALSKLFGFGHVQNDNILAKKSASLFAKNIYESFSTNNTRVVIADRNNHMFHERASLIKDVRELRKVKDPKVNFIAIAFDQSKEIRNMTTDRVLTRGDNHQSIRAATMSAEEIKGIMDGFHRRFQALNLEKIPDASFVEVFEVDPLAGSRKNLEIVVEDLKFRGLIAAMPTVQQMDDALALGLSYKPEVYKVVTSHESERKAKQKEASKKPTELQKSQKPGVQDHEKVSGGCTKSTAKSKGIKFYGLQVLDPDALLLALESIVDTNESVSHFWQQLKSTGRIQKEFHVTLIHESNKNSHAETWAYYSEMLPAIRDNNYNVHIEDVRCDDRVLAVTVDAKGLNLPYANKVLHITIGTASPQIKPVESNTMLSRSNSQKIAIDLSITCKISAYTR